MEDSPDELFDAIAVKDLPFPPKVSPETVLLAYAGYEMLARRPTWVLLACIGQARWSGVGWMWGLGDLLSCWHSGQSWC